MLHAKVADFRRRRADPAWRELYRMMRLETLPRLCQGALRKQKFVSFGSGGRARTADLRIMMLSLPIGFVDEFTAMLHLCCNNDAAHARTCFKHTLKREQRQCRFASAVGRAPTGSQGSLGRRLRRPARHAPHQDVRPASAMPTPITPSSRVDRARRYPHRRQQERHRHRGRSAVDRERRGGRT